MARNAERSNEMLNKWVAMNEDMAKIGPKGKRPLVASECHRLGDAEHWRREIIRDVTRKVAQIQNAGLGEHRARDLNDEINRLLREKVHWEKRVVELGGPDYAKASGDLAAAEGKELPGSGGYMYFGVMKDLPGIRELFAEEAQRRAKRKRGDILKTITPDYYGWRDDEDERLAADEAEAETEAQRRADEEWAALRKLHGLSASLPSTAAAPGGASTQAAAGGAGPGAGSFEGAGMRALAPLPSEKEVEAAVLRAKKRKLLEGLGLGGAGGGAGAGTREEAGAGAQPSMES